MHKQVAVGALSVALVMGSGVAADDIKPGLWKIALESGVAATPDWKPQPFEMTQCFSEADAQNPDRLLLSMSSSDVTNCELTNRQYSGNSLAFDVSCAGALGIKGHGQVSFSSTSLDGVLNVTIGSNEKIEMQNKIHASYLGDCLSTGSMSP